MQNISNKINQRFQEMAETGHLFRSVITGQQVWETYLNGFTNDPVFRDPNSSVHNCNTCKSFIRRYGNIVALDEDYNIMTMFDTVIDDDPEYTPSYKAMSELLKSAVIGSVFVETKDSLSRINGENTNNGFKTIASNVKLYEKEDCVHDVMNAGDIKTFHHMYAEIPSQYINTSGKSVEALIGEQKAKYDVLSRTFETISLDTLQLVMDLINQDAILNGKTHLPIIEQVIGLYSIKPDTNIDNWIWLMAVKLSERVAKFRNTLIGVLCVELSEGMDLNKACLNWNKRVDPANYMRASAPITTQMIKMAEEFVVKNNYVESFDRKLASVYDISADEILHLNESEETPSVTLFSGVKPSKSTRHKRAKFDNVSEVSIDEFMSKILPQCTSVEAFVENRFANNFVNLTTSKNKESKGIFKWNNNFSWTFNGNLAGKSEIREAVKSQGGGVDGVLRFSIMWAEDNIDRSDLDAHCIEPSDNLIYYGRKHGDNGILDIDITRPQLHKGDGKKVVENITFNKVVEGDYLFKINQYAERNSQGYKAEIEFDGQIYQYEFIGRVTGNNKIATVSVKNGQMSITHHDSSGKELTRDIWNINTNEFHKVNLVCLSPNHWGENNIGNKHYLFMLEGCKNNQQVRSFHNENLLPELAEHRKVLQVLGNQSMITPEGNDQLAGIGFNATVRDELIVKCKGNFERVIKIKF